MTKKEIGEKISRTRSKKKISTYTINKTAKISPTQLVGMETGEKNYTINGLLNLCSQLGLEVVLK